jgi:hypothetical protein
MTTEWKDSVIVPIYKTVYSEYSDQNLVSSYLPSGNVTYEAVCFVLYGREMICCLFERHCLQLGPYSA